MSLALSTPGVGTDVRHSFPKGFVWGAASAAYQIEGGWNADGKGLSVWDAFSHQAGATWMDQTADEACDHYHRYEEDVALMRAIGLKAYRLSISWPRVLPEGTGTVNAQGLDFYDRLIDSLVAAGIDPWVTLYHWDLPNALHTRGGWATRDIADWFAEYTAVVVDRLSDRVTHWITINEIQPFVNLGYRYGLCAPGLKLSFPEVLTVIHHALLAHGRAVQAIRAHAKRPCLVGCASAGFPMIPASTSPEDIEAARSAMLGDTRLAWDNAWFMDPLLLGTYPRNSLPEGVSPPTIEAGDMDTIRQHLDFFGVNIYKGDYVHADAKGDPVKRPFSPGFPISRYNFEITPEALRWGPRFLYEKYRLPVYVLENGVSLPDWVCVDGAVHDPQRIDFMKRYLRELAQAVSDGADVRGYFHWSILDNFEWHAGYKERFGLVYVDFTTKRRTLKDSAHWYREVIESNGGKALHSVNGHAIRSSVKVHAPSRINRGQSLLPVIDAQGQRSVLRTSRARQ